MVEPIRIVVTSDPVFAAYEFTSIPDGDWDEIEAIPTDMEFYAQNPPRRSKEVGMAGDET